MILFPPCKINLGLRVISKREDGYHELETVMFQIPFHDVLDIVKANIFSLKTTGIKIESLPENNLCVKAYELLKQDFNLSPVKIHLHKNIPMGAGLGGGSADGTYTLLALNQLFDLKLNPEQLQKYALKLGSDCPLFVVQNPQLAKGRGEILDFCDINLDSYYIHLINLGIHISTKDAFSNIELNKNETPVLKSLNTPLENWKNTLKNDFEVSVFKKFPALDELKEKLYQNGAIYSAMTGSGSTLFAIYKEKPNLLFSTSKENVLEKIVQIK